MSNRDDLDAAIKAAKKTLNVLPEEEAAECIASMMRLYEEHIDDLEDEHQDHAADLQDQLDRLSDGDNFEEIADSSEDAINRFLDCVDRPVGTRDFTIPKSGESTQAIIGLYDAIGRKM